MGKNETSGDGVACDKRTRIAAFDYDGTIISGQSGALFASYLFAHGYLRLARALRLGWWGVRYVLHLPYRQGEAREQVFSALSERTPEEVHRIMMDFHDEVLLRRYRQEAIREIGKRKREGCTILLVSATFKDIAQRAVRVTGADDFVATGMELDANGNYTGNVDGAVIAGPEKTKAVIGWANEHIGTDAWTIAYSYADHHSDADLLAASEKAYAVTPGKALRLKAKRQHWQVLNWG